MASRGKYISRPTGHGERDDQREAVPPSLSRRLSVASSSSSASKIPAYKPSFFSRSKSSKPSRVEAEPSKSRSEGSSRRVLGAAQLPADAVSTKVEPTMNVSLHSSKSTGLGIASVSVPSPAEANNSEKRHRNVLRRKASAADQHAQYARTESSKSSYEPGRRYDTASSPGAVGDPFAGSVFGVALPIVSSSTSYLPSLGTSNYDQATSSSRMTSFNPRSGAYSLSPQALPPPTPSFAHSSGSSTRRSESPGSFSRTSTPTSMSSQSPGIPLPAKSPLKIRQISPTRSRPPVTRRKIRHLLPDDDTTSSRDQGLAPLRESGTSSSSSSTIKGARRLSPNPPSPPLRHSSKRFVSSRDKHQQSPSASDSGASLSKQPERTTRTTEGLGEPHQRLVTSQSRQMKGPPPRPSREGTPKLDDSSGPSPVIQSNLSRLVTTGHKRRESLEKSFPILEPRVGPPSKSQPALIRSPSTTSSFSGKPSRLPSPNPASGEHLRQRPAEVLQTRDVPSLDTNIGGGRIKDLSPLSAISGKSPARFGLFSKRTKTPSESSTTEGIEKPSKRGPIAGTGHEGYGKYAKRGRSGSVSTSASRGRSTSTGASNSLARTPTSRKSSIASREEPELDDFLLERLEPVIISGGGGIVENRRRGTDLYRTTSEESSIGRSSNEAFDSKRTIGFSQRGLPQPVLAPGPVDTKLPRRGSRVLADGRDALPPGIEMQINNSGDPLRRPTLAARRSLHRSQLFKEAEPIRIPTPINTGAQATAPAMNSYDTMLSSALRTDSTQILTDDISEGREGNWLKARKTEKRARSPRKWNFFHRSHATPKKEEPKFRSEETKIREVPVTIARIPESRSIAHYAMLDSNDQEGFNSAENLTPENPSQTHSSTTGSVAKEIDTDVYKQDHKHSMLLPSPPHFPTEFRINQGPCSPIVLVRPPDMVASGTPIEPPPKPREPRLQQVGRIPRVISKRDRLHKPAPQSFSRPFIRAPALVSETLAFAPPQNHLNNTARPVLGVQTQLIPSAPWEDEDSAQIASAPVQGSTRFSPISKKEFIAFSPRKGSDVSGSSSSEMLSFSATTAVARQSHGIPGEDEVWNEYDELLDIVESPEPLPNASQAQGKGKASRSRVAPAPLFIRRDSTAAGAASSPIETSPMTSRRVGPTADLPVPPRVSHLLSPLQSADMVSTPLSFSDFFAGYGDRNRISNNSRRQSGSSRSRHSSRSIRSKVESFHSEDNGNGRRDTDIMVEKTDTIPDTQSNLRFSALMTSRWLSFGRVLFSAAHSEIQSNRQDRVLVLDGLGNDDWSFYCALTYPNATVYNLSPFQGTAHTPSKTQAAGGFGSPSNHRQIYHTSIAHPFPFPKGFFTAAVFRFPVASSEVACSNAISECKRVLRPGGFLEMSILDLDMVNMGDRARRAVRMLKLKMQVAEPEVSLKPASDNIQKMLGRRGFENLNRCMVNVPIAGYISDSRAGSFDEKNMSLGDMLKDPSQQGDEDITKMVAKVGRWWYSRCYEMGVLPHDQTERSIWADKALLKECEKMETGLKLLICYAQKPLSPKRRTVSM